MCLELSMFIYTWKQDENTEEENHFLQWAHKWLSIVQHNVLVNDVFSNKDVFS